MENRKSALKSFLLTYTQRYGLLDLKKSISCLFIHHIPTQIPYFCRNVFSSLLFLPSGPETCIFRIWGINDINLRPLSSFTTPTLSPGLYKSSIKPLVCNYKVLPHGCLRWRLISSEQRADPAESDQDKHTPHRSIILIRFKGFGEICMRMQSV